MTSIDSYRSNPTQPHPTQPNPTQTQQHKVTQSDSVEPKSTQTQQHKVTLDLGSMQLCVRLPHHTGIAYCTVWI